MSSWLRALAVAGLAALGVAVLVVLLQPAAPATRAEQARALAAELRCPDCESLSVAESRTAAAAAIRAEIDEQLAAGRTPAEIRAAFVARYGEWILLQPTNPLILLVPALALLGGLGALAWWLRGRTGASAPSAVPPAGAERDRVREEAHQLDG